MTRTASSPLRITNVFVLSVVVFVVLAADRSLSQNAPLFLAAKTYGSSGQFNIGVAVGDVNGDGKLDIVGADYCVPNCAEPPLVGGFGVLLGNGDGTFQPASVHSLSAGTASSIALADLNGDGRLDVVVSTTTESGCFAPESSIAVFLGNGDGTFQPQQSYETGGLCASSLVVADVNGDGKRDVLVVNKCRSNLGYCSDSIDGIVAVLLGNGDGSFKTAQTYDSGVISPASLTVSNVNEDGKLDLLVNGESDNGNVNAVVLLGNGDGTFQTAKIFNTSSMGIGSLAVADLNGDGKLDVVETTCLYSRCGQNAGGLAVQFGNGDGTFQAPRIYNSGRTVSTFVALADVNLDGKLDAVLVSYNECSNCAPGGVSVLLGNGDGTFSTSFPPPHFSSGGAGAVSAVLGDVNGDGRLDVIVANQETLCGVRCISPAGAASVLLGAARFPTTVTFVSSLNPSIYGQPVSFVARVTTSGSFNLTGQVQFKGVGGSVIGAARLQSDGTATLTKSNLNAGSYPLTAVYSGDANDLSSTSTVVNQLIEQTKSAATISSSPNPSTQGQAVTFTATISSPTVKPTGPVTFTAGKTVLGTAQLVAGKAKLSISSLSAGSTKVTATYYSNSNIAKSSASVTQTVR